MSILYSTCSTPRSISRLTVPSAFDEKYSELDQLKKKATHYLRRFNSLKVEYMNWWSNRRSGFLTVLSSVQIINRHLCPQTITCLDDYYKLLHMADIYTRTKKLLHVKHSEGIEDLRAYGAFWNRLQELHAEYKETTLSPVSIYCDSITRLREPAIKKKIDHKCLESDLKCDTAFNFTDIHDTKVNLFAYNLGLQDKDLLGFIGFLPHVTDINREVCYLITKLAIEKE